MSIWRRFIALFKKKPNTNLPYCEWDPGYGFVVTRDELVLSQLRLTVLQRKGKCGVYVLDGWDYSQRWFVISVQCPEVAKLFRKHGFPAPSRSDTEYYRPRAAKELLTENLGWLASKS